MPSRDRCNLRAMTESDLTIVREWRNSDRVRPFMYSVHVISEDEHAAWWSRAKDDPRSRYYVFEVDGRPVGSSNVVEMDPVDLTASWGFYIGAEDAPPGSGSAMEFLTVSEVFGPLGIRKLCGEVFATNTRSLKMQKKLGFKDEGILRAHRYHDGVYEDVIRIALFAEEWPPIAERVAPIMFRD
jgi:UDP-4-amino-4,6-dideoxy-N-acetyl-beta-L-altrosamine N-acetyltransferase